MKKNFDGPHCPKCHLRGEHECLRIEDFMVRTTNIPREAYDAGLSTGDLTRIRKAVDKYMKKVGIAEERFVPSDRRGSRKGKP